MVKLLYIDLFCGAGGTSTGVNSATVNGARCAEVIACVNHDANAIASHKANHPDALHFTEDIRTLDLTPLCDHLKRCRRQNPDALVVLWASLECTNFSKAKGGLPRDGDSRTLAEHLFRYIDFLNPDYIQIENVEEFMSWGDIDEHGKPISKDKGRCYIQWVNNVKSCGYDFEHRILNAADYGAYTARRRFFGIFAKLGRPIVFPEPTHAKKGNPQLFGELPQWKAVRHVLDLGDYGKSIFRDKPLSERTLTRIYAGLIKFVAGGKNAFLVKYNSMSQRGKYVPPSLDEPCPTVATQGRLALATVHFLSKQFSGNPYDKNVSVDEPAGAITTIDHHALVQAQFIDMYYGNGKPSGIDAPAPTVTTKPKHGLVTATSCLMDACINNAGSCIDKPAKVSTADRQHFYLMNTQYNSVRGSIEAPCFTLIARMDKRPPYLVATEQGQIAIEVYETDSPMTVKIKEFMAMYGLEDIKMRMLRINELKKIQGFPVDYVLIGTQAEQKKYLGNAVEVTIARKICEALYLALYHQHAIIYRESIA